jgi:hypothetical protein
MLEIYLVKTSKQYREMENFLGGAVEYLVTSILENKRDSTLY